MGVASPVGSSFESEEDPWVFRIRRERKKWVKYWLIVLVACVGCVSFSPYSSGTSASYFTPSAPLLFSYQLRRRLGKRRKTHNQNKLEKCARDCASCCLEPRKSINMSTDKEHRAATGSNRRWKNTATTSSGTFSYDMHIHPCSWVQPYATYVCPRAKHEEKQQEN